MSANSFLLWCAFFKKVVAARGNTYSGAKSKYLSGSHIWPKHFYDTEAHRVMHWTFIHLKGAAKLYFIYFSRPVIILFSTGLYKSAFSTHSFGKLGYRVSVFFVLSVWSISWIRCVSKGLKTFDKLFRCSFSVAMYGCLKCSFSSSGSFGFCQIFD